jgi:MFS transporter, ACS family, pantothenate transporter
LLHLPVNMALSISYYAKNIFASSYGANRPEFFLWYPKGTSSSEKKLLHKIDFFILTYGCLAYFTKWLDQSNLSNAYVRCVLHTIPCGSLEHD